VKAHGTVLRGRRGDSSSLYAAASQDALVKVGNSQVSRVVDGHMVYAGRMNYVAERDENRPAAAKRSGRPFPYTARVS
jgi:hypothetical protein